MLGAYSASKPQISANLDHPSLTRALSKDYLYQDPHGHHIRHNKYQGTNSIVEAGRQESQRMLMERYRRIDTS